MKLLNVDVEVKSKQDKVTLIPLGDLHLGNICCDLEAFKEAVQYINDTPNTYTLLMGDLVDAIVHTDNKRFDIDTIDTIYTTPEDQIQELVKILKPLADKKKIWGLLEGNHEHELKKRSYIPVCRRLSQELNVPFPGYQTAIRLNIRRKSPRSTSFDGWTTIIYAHHGTGAGRSAGARLNKLIKLNEGWEADIYLMGHLHDCIGHTNTKLTISRKGKLKMVESTHIYGMTGSFLKSYTDDETSTYSERAGYTPTTIGTIRIEFDVAKKKREIFS